MSKRLIQEEMIDQVRHLCYEDQRIQAALMYGSFARGEGDEFSDIEFYLFIDSSEYKTFDQVEWIGQVAPIFFNFVTPQGISVAIFKNLIRGEFHFLKSSEMPGLRAFRQIASFPDTDSMRIIDRTGELQKYLDYLSGPGPDRQSRESVLTLYHNLLTTILSGIDQLGRGERARSLDTLGMVQRLLLWLVRIQEGKILHSESRAFRNLEKDLSNAAYDRYVTCTGSLREQSLEHAYQCAWAWSKELMTSPANPYESPIDRLLIESLDSRFLRILEGRGYLP
jgi:lincosamide nucleotidyltransferase B/F